MVQKGDTLSLIARKFYGDPAKLHLLEEANRNEQHAAMMAESTYDLTERKRMRYESWQTQRGRRQPPRE